MGIAHYLQQRGKKGTYHFRIRVPVSIKPYIKNSPNELTKSLKTSDIEKALPLARQLLKYAQQTFENIEKRVGESNEYIVIKLTTVGSDAIVKPVENPISNSTITESYVSNRPVILLSKLIDIYCKNQISMSWRGSTEHDAKAILALFLNIMGDINVEDINRQMALEFRDLVVQLPPGIKKSPKFRNKTLEQILELKPKRMSRRTAEKYIIQVSSMFKWGYENEFVSKNSFKGLSLKKSKEDGGRVRKSFNQQEVMGFFLTDNYNKYAYNSDWKYWLIPFLLHGMRLAEATGLRTIDIRPVDGHFVFVIRPHEKRNLKNDSANRIVPINDTLLDKNFLEFLSVRKDDKKNNFLFPDLKFVKQRGKLQNTRNVTNWFNGTENMKGYKEKAKIIIEVGERKDLHSFRHTVANNFKNLGEKVSPHVVQYLMGHHQKEYDITFQKYGEEHEIPLLLEAVEKLPMKDYFGHIEGWLPEDAREEKRKEIEMINKLRYG